jgi:N-acetylglucosaminyldiphosphoundecaprenol N-acetyl-beta-D-mannosaminyltransferase
MTQNNMAKPTNILGIKIDPLTKTQALENISELLNKKNKSQIATVNTEFVMMAQHYPDFLDTVNKSKLRLADGVGMLIAAKFLSQKLSVKPYQRKISVLWKLKICVLASIFAPKYLTTEIPERISGADLTVQICEIAAKNKLKVFLLGAAPGVAEKAALQLQTDIYDLRVAGTFAGTPKIEDEAKIIELINKNKADILFVAYGAPAQDLWIRRNLKKTSCKLAMGVGGTFDFIAGEVKRAPKVWQNHGLEWLYRLIQQPSRLKRVVSLPKLLRALYKYKLQSG